MVRILTKTLLWSSCYKMNVIKYLCLQTATCNAVMQLVKLFCKLVTLFYNLLCSFATCNAGL